MKKIIIMTLLVSVSILLIGWGHETYQTISSDPDDPIFPSGVITYVV